MFANRPKRHVVVWLAMNNKAVMNNNQKNIMVTKPNIKKTPPRSFGTIFEVGLPSVREKI